MTDEQFERNLVSIGLGVFVEFYLDFANEALTNGEVEEKIWKAHKFSEKSCRSRTSHARSIINSGRGVEGLQRAANSKRLRQDQRKRAEQLIESLCAREIKMDEFDWTDVYQGYWDKIWGSEDPKPEDGEYYQRQLLHPFFRLDLAIGYDLETVVNMARVPKHEPTYNSFAHFLKEHFSNRIAETFHKIFDADEYLRENGIFDRHYLYFMTCPPGPEQQRVFQEELCPRVVKLLEIATKNKFRDEDCSNFLPLVLVPFHYATLRVLEQGMSKDNVTQCWQPFLESAKTQFRNAIYVPRHTSDLDVFIHFISELYGFLILTGNGLGMIEALNSLDPFVSTRKNIGELTWRELSLNGRFKFAMCALFALTTIHPYGRVFDKTTVETDTLLYIRKVLIDLNKSLVDSGGSRYAATIRFFIGKIDDAFDTPPSFHLIRVENFSEYEQFVIQGLVDRFRLYRHPVTEDRLVNFLAQFGSKRNMQLALRLLQNVTFLTFENLQNMLEDAFTKFVNNDSIKTFCPLGNVSGSAGLMSYLASHWSLDKANFEPSIESALENTAEGEPICVVDDGAFAGVQIVNIFKDLLGTRVLKAQHTKYCQVLKEPEVLRKRPVRLCLAIACDKAIENIRKELPPTILNDFQIQFSRLEVLDSKPFEKSMSFIWETDDDRIAAKALFRRIGTEILADLAITKKWPKGRDEESSLGFGDHQRLIVYQYNLPKSTVTPLWRTGKFDRRTWIPLFPLCE